MISVNIKNKVKNDKNLMQFENNLIENCLKNFAAILRKWLLKKQFYLIFVWKFHLLLLHIQLLN